MTEKPPKPVTESPWTDWRRLTPARLALGRVGAGMPTDEVLRFGWAHAMARDAIHAPFDAQSLEATLRDQGWNPLQVHSRAADRATYLRRPDLGRVLDPGDIEKLKKWPVPRANLCFVVGDGLSSLAIERHAAPLLEALKRHLATELHQTPLIIATQARVALADDIAAVLKPRLVIMLIGERPGLSSPDSLGIYITHAPFVGRSDADRNCISNVRPEGLTYDAAAFRLAWLVREAFRRQLTGVDLKDESDLKLLDGHANDGPYLSVAFQKT
ncbi:MAG: ethanolamine ammonia-lyase subunit EutC [Xanthobacteraceae bacterium]|nr:ethanolamine ammonia-lyase subunit EutC [Xanthobacteraceae bacterium]